MSGGVPAALMPQEWRGYAPCNLGGTTETRAFVPIGWEGGFFLFLVFWCRVRLPDKLIAKGVLSQMKWTGLNELREQFLEFFESKGHLRLDSFPLVPQDDKSLLLINSGMAPMKKWFLGQAEPPRHRVATCQKCIRTPDIERVGITARHGTFFEMLGNFSFQDYFKKEAIPWAWEFFTQVLEIPADRLYVSVYLDDDEAYDIWTKEVGVPESHMVRFGKEDNFWEHGSGPCGPCSEIYYDRGEQYGCGKPDCKVGCDCDRYMEVWNLVFSQFDSDGKGTYTRLERPNIDTGMGLERLACVMQGVDNLFEVDTVNNILKAVEAAAGVHYKENEKQDISIRVITDHIRSTVFMVSDGVLPSNNGRGYVLRRLLRRAARHGRMLGIHKPFLGELCDTVIRENGDAYPELREHADYIKKIISIEEASFAKTIDQGMSLLGDLMESLKKTGSTVLDGAEAFRLQDTFGFPIDLTKEILAESGIQVDEEGFQAALEKQRQTAKADHAAKAGSSWAGDLFQELEAPLSQFVGYETLSCQGTVLAVADGERLCDSISAEDNPESVLLVLDRTPFYAESGGQVGDQGVITAEGLKLAVTDCHKTVKGYFVHTCRLEEGMIAPGMQVDCQVDPVLRASTARNHTAAHLLQAALRQVLGDHVHQAGQLVSPAHTRFDFTHFAATTPEELRRIEDLVNEKILAALPVVTREMPIQEAKAMGAIALFGEKYGDIVRVVDAEGFSTEFCGGTHVTNTAQLGMFKIVSESSVAAGVRRIEAVTGMNTLALVRQKEDLLAHCADLVKAQNPADLPARIENEKNELRQVRAELEALKDRLASGQLEELFQKGADVEGIQVFAAHVKGADADGLRKMAEQAKASYPASVTVLCGGSEKLNMVVACGKEAVARGLKAGLLIKEIAAIAGGNGGGKPDFAMAGLKDASKLEEAAAAAAGIVRSHLG